MKFRLPEIILGCLLTVAIFAMGMMFASSGRTVEAIGPNWLTKDASGFFAGLQAIVAAIQAVLFVYQLRLIRDSLDDAKAASTAATRQAHVAEETLNKIERPYLFVFNVSPLKIQYWQNADGERWWVIERHVFSCELWKASCRHRRYASQPERVHRAA
jgi:hypothetical protein